MAPTTAAMVYKAEDSNGQIWALKRVQADAQTVREAERLVKLHKHPLVVPLHSIFQDSGVTYLQMTFYKNGDLRAWVEKIKVSLEGLLQLCMPRLLCLPISALEAQHVPYCSHAYNACRSLTKLAAYPVYLPACKASAVQ